MNRVPNKMQKILDHNDQDLTLSLKEQKLQTIKCYRLFSNGKEEESKYILVEHSLDGKHCQW